MASLQPTRHISSSEIDPKHQDDLENLKNQVLAAQKWLPWNQVLQVGCNQGCYPRAAGAAQESASTQVVAGAAMLNKGNGTLTFHDKKNWVGSVFGSYPPQIKVGNSAEFTHNGEKGSKGGVIYKGPNKEFGSEDCAWVLAWSAPGNGKPKQVYVETGSLKDYTQGAEAKWEAIRINLEKSSDTSYYLDKNTKAEANASITADWNRPTISAVFNVVPI